jgi:hypothetical protein
LKICIASGRTLNSSADQGLGAYACLVCI